MIQLVITVCSILHGAHCYTLDPIPLQEGVGMLGCLLGAQQEAAKWQAEHPNYSITKMVCEPFGRYARS